MKTMKTLKNVSTSMVLTSLMAGRCFFSCAEHFRPTSIKRCHKLSGHCGVSGSRKHSKLLQSSTRLFTRSTYNVFTTDAKVLENNNDRLTAFDPGQPG